MVKRTIEDYASATPSRWRENAENLSLETISKIEDALEMEFQSVPLPVLVER
ncbi:MAG: hypothetical protein LIP02_10110 [Bacteroidales bacterium]|nr:hypothetical protein [Bacteroidales bacterium]